MRVVCDNCGATYKIPEHKLVKEVNKATCRKCGHRMLIRRPASARPSASASAGPSSGRASAAGDEPTRLTRSPIPPDPSSTGSGARPAASAEQASSSSGPDSASAWSDDAPTRLARDPMAARDRARSSSAPSPAPEERPTVAMDPPAPAPKPAPAPAAAASPAPSPPQTGPRPAPAAAAPAPTSPAFDPSGDLGWALGGALLAGLGAVLMGINITDSPALRTAGLFLALWGTLTTVFVLLTGSRGRQKASLGISLSLSTVLALVCAGGVALVYAGIEEMDRIFTTGGQPTTTQAPPPRTAPRSTPPKDDGSAAAALAEDEPEQPEEPEEEPIQDDEGEDAVAAAAVAPSQPEEQPRTTSSRPTTTTTSSSRSTTTSTRSEPTPPPPAPEPEPEPEPEEPEQEGLNTMVVETILRNNKNIKRCFYKFKQENGSLPPRVDVRFSVQNSGQVTSARVTTDRYKGTDFDVCLGSAFRGIQFPPFGGDPVTMTYPFVL